MSLPDTTIIAANVRIALDEDIGSGDLSAALVDSQHNCQAAVTCRDKAVLCGAPWFVEVFRQINPKVDIEWLYSEGDEIDAGQIVCRLQGPARAILSGERTALNFLQMLSGVASVARRFARLAKGSSTRLLDTRKTLPGLRAAQKYAVTQGGCANHRMGLFDALMIKENHIKAGGSITALAAEARRIYPGKKLEIEAENLSQLKECLNCQADVVLLDNFSIDDLRAAVAMNRGQAILEASGGIDERNLAAIIASGVDCVSIGALSKHCRATDLSLKIVS